MKCLSDCIKSEQTKMTCSKLPKYKELAEYLKVSNQAVKQYNPIKRELMLIGLKYKKAWIDDPKQPKPSEVIISGKIK